MLLTPGNLTPTETRIWRLLSDGMYHATSEMMTTLADPMSSQGALRKAITMMRKKIGPYGYDVMWRHKSFRLIRTIGGDND